MTNCDESLKTSFSPRHLLPGSRRSYHDHFLNFPGARICSIQNLLKAFLFAFNGQFSKKSRTLEIYSAISIDRCFYYIGHWGNIHIFFMLSKDIIVISVSKSAEISEFSILTYIQIPSRRTSHKKHWNGHVIMCAQNKVVSFQNNIFHKPKNL